MAARKTAAKKRATEKPKGAELVGASEGAYRIAVHVPCQLEFTLKGRRAFLCIVTEDGKRYNLEAFN